MKRMCLLCFVLVLGCKSSELTHIASKPGTTMDAGPDVEIPQSGRSGGKAGSGAAATVNGPGSPIVEILQPKAAADPNQDVVLTDSSVIVRCKVTRSMDSTAMDVNKSAVVITLDQPTDATKKIMPAVNAATGGVYEATFDLAALPNGPLHFRCEAKDLATKPHVGDAAVDTLLDNGPKVEVLEPKAKGIYTLKTPVAIQFQVTPRELAPGDTKAAVTEVQLTVSGVVVPVEEATDMPGLYQTTVDFDDKALFPVRPTSAEVRVVARNNRMPTPGTRDVKLDIGIDGDGPVIKIEAPADTQLVHGNVVLKLNVSDSSGVKKDSLVANINHDQVIIKSWDSAPPIYQQKFDTNSFKADEVTQLTINITASDMVGNQTKAELLLRLDNRAPILSMDPPFVRDMQNPNSPAKMRTCSAPYDPVGDWAPNDLEQIQAAAYYRVMIEDRTNTGEGAHFSYLAGVARDKVDLHAQVDSDLPLLIDKTGDGICDEINDAPAAKRVFVRLAPLDPKGGAVFYASGSQDTPEHFTNMQCLNPGPEDPKPPAPPPMGTRLCGGTEMFKVVAAYLNESRSPAIYALTPTNGGGGECEGAAWELSSALGGYFGWVCLAARGEDSIGNVGVSPPLRVCISPLDPKVHDPQCDASLAPTCLGKPSPSFMPCKLSAELFPRDQIYPL